MRIKGKGHLEHVADGVWRGRFSLGPDPDRPGKYLYTPKRTFYCEEEWEARNQFEAYRIELEEYGIPDKDIAYLGAFAERWLMLREGTHGSPRTADRERSDVRNIQRLFPNVKLEDLTVGVIKTAYKDARDSGRFDKELYQINKRLRQILKEAVIEGQIRRNPADYVVVPKPEPEPKDYLDAERLAKFNTALRSLPLCGEVIGAQILLRTGIRPAEMYGSSWKFLDEKASRLFIGEQYSNDLQLRRPKSRASRDWVVIDSELLAMLLAWKKIQKGDLEAIGVEQTPETPIASNSLGGRFDPTNYGRWFRNFCVDNGFGEYTVVTKKFERDGKTITRGRGYVGLCPNMFRDIQATQLVGVFNVDARTLQSRLRHSDPRTSLKFYTHPMLENEYRAAENFGKLVRGEVTAPVPPIPSFAAGLDLTSLAQLANLLQALQQQGILAASPAAPTEIPASALASADEGSEEGRAREGGPGSRVA